MVTTSHSDLLLFLTLRIHDDKFQYQIFVFCCCFEGSGHKYLSLVQHFGNFNLFLGKAKCPKAMLPTGRPSLRYMHTLCLIIFTIAINVLLLNQQMLQNKVYQFTPIGSRFKSLYCPVSAFRFILRERKEREAERQRERGIFFTSFLSFLFFFGWGGGVEERGVNIA